MRLVVVPGVDPVDAAVVPLADDVGDEFFGFD